ncbi:MAG: linear amide C-N hydrolase [Candidatus Endonucleobacter sp. (ex Gigantidas childressi)]|nr:linear amide C-N hydrolase [Candidatus Endonucleobacter sp. (ex Gigantidas childressi)]
MAVQWNGGRLIMLLTRPLFRKEQSFVRAVVFTQTARPTKTTGEAISELFRILDHFNLPLGFAEGSDESHTNTDGMRSSTRWTTGYDTKNLILYYHTQHNRRIRKLNLKAIGFSTRRGEVLYQPVDKEEEQDTQDIAPITNDDCALM